MTEEQLAKFEKAVQKERLADRISKWMISWLFAMWLLWWIYPHTALLVGIIPIFLLVLIRPSASPFLRSRPADTYRQIIEEQISKNPDMIRRLAADRVADHPTPAKEI